MKQFVYLLSFLFTGYLSSAQTTYYWVGGTGPISFTSNSKWNTALNGSGAVRTVADPTDILIVDGTNVGGSTPTTGPVTATCGSTAFSRLELRNNANLTLQRIAAGTGTITVNGDGTPTDDIIVPAGCSLTNTSVDPANGNNLTLMANSTARIYGNFTVSVGASRVSVLNTVAGGAMIFESGSVCNVNTDMASAYPFGSNSGAQNGIVFKNGSTLNFLGGNSIFTSTSTFNPVVFNPGSTFVIQTSIPSALVTSSNLFAARNFSNVVIAANSNVVGDAFYNIDNLTIESGSTFYLKSSGASPVSGNIVNNGTFGSNTGFTSSNLLMKGITPQSIGGTGTFLPIGAISVAVDANVTLNTSLTANGTSNCLINGKINFQQYVLSGSNTLQTKAASTITTAVTAAVVGSQSITLDATAYNGTTNTAGVYNGLLVSGTGVPPNTYIIGTSSSASTITVSNPITATPPNITLSGGIPVIRTSNVNGIDGTITTTGISYTTATDYIYDGPTTQPFSIRSPGTVRNITFNASATTNRSLPIDSALTVNAGVLSIRPTDTLRIKNGLSIGGGTFNSTKYIATLSDATSTGVLRMDLVNVSRFIPIGTATDYLPVTLTPAAISSFALSAYPGITANGAINGAALTGAAYNAALHATWNINRFSGSGPVDIQVGWPSSLEGTTLAIAADNRMGMIQHDGTAWGNPIAPGNNSANTASATVSLLGLFSVGSLPPANSFIFNALPNKTYGDADFSVSATSLNVTQPINYTSSNTSVATINAAGLIHIVGAGTTNITAQQNSDGTYSDASVAQPLIVAKAPLNIRADDKTKFEGAVNPAFTATYTGFVLNETASVLQVPVAFSTTATTSSVAGTYPIVPSGATADNYNISYTNGVLTILPRQNTFVFNALPSKTYGDADFSTGVVTQNVTQPVVYTSSNPLVATVNAAGIIHIVGAGTTNINAQQATDGVNASGNVTQTLVIAKAALQVRADNKTRYELNPNPIFTATYTGFVLGETSNVLQTPVSFSTTAVLSSVPGNYPIVPSGAAAANYNITYTNGTLTILARLNTFSFNALPTKVYGNADFSAGVVTQNVAQPVTYTSSNPLVATVNASGIIHIVGAGTTNINAQQATDGVYADGNVTQSLVINKASLTIAADNKQKYEGMANPTLTATYTGFVLGESESVLTTPVSLSTTATTASTPGTYPITSSAATAANYNITFVAGTLTVLARQAQTISFSAPATKTYGDADFIASISSTNSTIPVVLSSSNIGVATILPGNIIHITGAGTTTLTASQAGSDAYLPANDVVVSLVVEKARLTIAVADTSRNEGASNPVFSIIYSGFVLGETAAVLTAQPTVSTSASQTSAPGVYALEVSGADAANYQLNYVNGRLTVYPSDRTASSVTVYQTGTVINIRVFSPEPDLADIRLFTVNGQFLGRKNSYLTPGFTNIQFASSNLSNGIYIIEYIGKKQRFSKQIAFIRQ